MKQEAYGDIEAIEVSPYSLERKDLKKEKKGALLKYSFQNGSFGVSDCHPWFEKKDPPLKKLLEDLKQRNFSEPLLQRSYETALEDSRLLSFDIPEEQRIKSHKLVRDSLDPEYDLLKCKIGDSPYDKVKKLISEIRPSQKLRLDFNCKLSKREFLSWLSEYKPWLIEHVEFIEDPFQGLEEEWRQCYLEHKIPLAWDQTRSSQGLQKGFQVLVVKPAVMSVDSMDKTFAVTSYLGHPLEQVSSYVFACRLAQRHPKKTLACGVISDFYRETVFSENLCFKDQKLYFPNEKHWGFETLLKRLPWKSLEKF